MKTGVVLSVLLLAGSAVCADTYQKPPKEVLRVLDAAPPPMVWANEGGTHLLLGDFERYPTIADLAQPWHGLAGVRVNPNTYRTQLLSYYKALRIKPVAGGPGVKVALPAGAKLSLPVWSPDGKLIAAANTTTSSYDLLLIDASTGRVRTVPGLRLNAVLGPAFQWVGPQTLLVRTVPAAYGKPPAAPLVPAGPVIQEGQGQSGPVRTNQDMLRNPHDEALFEHFATVQLAYVDVASGKTTSVGKPGTYASFSSSPDGRHLLVTRIEKPYSYLHYFMQFPRSIEVWDRTGKPLRTVAKLPLADNVPIEGVQTGPRSVSWLATQPATLTWVEALDGGDPRKKVAHRDRMVMLAAPFQGEPAEVAKLPSRYAGQMALEGGTQALVTDYERGRRWVTTRLVDYAKPGSEPRQIWSRNVNDRYKDPGSPVMKRLASGHSVVRLVNGTVLLEGQGATPAGDRPFLDRMRLDTLETQRLFQSGANEYESVVEVASDDGSRIITRRESPADPPNVYLRASGQVTKLTDYQDPVPELRRIKKQLVKYKRADGVDLSFTLYLPPDYKEGTRLPTVVWAYPLDFTDPATAGQVVGSPQRFTQLAGTSQLFYVLAGYALLDNASMPLVGDPENFNNTFVDQIVSSAKAAIDKAAEMGVTDPGRVGVIGHSYGAFMTANLLAHSDLFRAGVARSGAYNRTLTPFGFQTERRTYWQSPDVYHKVSPFSYAHKINEPLLMIHGMADNNQGTFPIQSERMYQAVRGNGGTVRLVMLPHESHGYMGRESVEHTLYEMISWFDRYVKSTPAGPSGSAPTE